MISKVTEKEAITKYAIPGYAQKIRGRVYTLRAAFAFHCHHPQNHTETC